MADSGLGSFRNNISAARTLEWWARATAVRNVQSLQEGAGPDGPPLAPLKPQTIRRKGGDARPGFGRGKLIERGLTAPGVVERKSDSHFRVRGAPRGSEAEDEVTFFVTGRKTVTKAAQKTARKFAKAHGIKATTLVGRAKKLAPARDFFGHDEDLVERAAEMLAEDTLRQLGFR